MMLQDSPRITRAECPLCGAALRRADDRVPDGIIECRTCNLLFRAVLTDETTVSAWEEFTFTPANVEYDLARSPFFDSLWTSIVRVSGQRTGRILDVGCGQGLLLRRARLSSWQAEGVEISSKQCDAAERYSGCRVFEGPVDTVRFRPGSYDLITLIDVFRHLLEPLGTLRTCTELLKPGGAIVIRDLNVKNSRSMRRFTPSASRHSEARDMQGLSPATATLFANRAGLNRVQVFPSPMSLKTIPGLGSLGEKSGTPIMHVANGVAGVIYILSLRRCLNITPEMLVVARRA